MNGRLFSLVLLILSLLWSAPALAWSDIGHRIICEIAFQELNDTARERVKAMIRRDPEFTTFAEACTWPDHPRQRAAEHYVNLPRDAEGFTKDPCRRRSGDPIAEGKQFHPDRDRLAARAVLSRVARCWWKQVEAPA